MGKIRKIKELWEKRTEHTDKINKLYTEMEIKVRDIEKEIKKIDEDRKPINRIEYNNKNFGYFCEKGNLTLHESNNPDNKVNIKPEDVKDFIRAFMDFIK